MVLNPPESRMIQVPSFTDKCRCDVLGLDKFKITLILMLKKKDNQQYNHR